jgi:RNA polymerase sigma factor (sigma-70 family)
VRDRRTPIADAGLSGVGVDAFYAAVEPHLAKMARVAGRLAGAADREDVVQDALVDAWRHRSSFDSERGSLSAWLMSITAHQAAKARRRAFRRLTALRMDAHDVDRELALDLATSLGRLTPRERLAVDCFYFVGLSAAETAAVMACSEGTVKSTLSSARRRLRISLR